MPRIAKGGKYVFGWSKVGKTGRIVIPKEAMKEYKFEVRERVILMSGSRRSGGFGITTLSLLKNSPFFSVLSRFPEFGSFQIHKATIIRVGEKAFCWTIIEGGEYITLPVETLKEYEIKIDDFLLTVRGSNLALNFLVKGPIIEEALRHPELQFFE